MRRNKIAVLCAFNPRNSGMYSVDLAALQFFDKLGRPYDLCTTQGRTHFRELPFRQVRDISDFREYGTIVYWGDFQNNPMWGINDFAPRALKYNRVPDREAGYRLWKKLYLNLAEEVGSNPSIVSVGGCFIGSEKYLEETDTLRNFHSFMQSAKQVIVRDTVSLDILSNVPGVDGRNVALGFDCASLLGVKPQPATRGDYFVYCFGRSIPPEDGRSIAEWIGDKFSVRAVPLNWLVTRWPKPFAYHEFRRNLALIRSAKFTITDTYHLIVNSFREGTPAFCLSRHEKEATGTLNEQKKETLIEMLDANPFLVAIGPEAPEASSRDQLAMAISDFRLESMQRVTEKLLLHRNNLEKKLLSALS